MKYKEKDVERLIDIAWDIVSHSLMRNDAGWDFYEVTCDDMNELEKALNELPEPNDEGTDV